jgi:hypothetical protein
LGNSARAILFLSGKLSLACGERVTFFAGANKVTKETPSSSRTACSPNAHPALASNGAHPARHWRYRGLNF